MQYDFNLTTNCSDTDLVALVHNYFRKSTKEKANDIIQKDYDQQPCY